MSWKHAVWNEYEFHWGYSLHEWALPIGFAAGFVNYGRRWGFGLRFLCFTLTAERDFQGYKLGSSIL